LFIAFQDTPGTTASTVEQQGKNAKVMKQIKGGGKAAKIVKSVKGVVPAKPPPVQHTM
jgi:hypothetical protein